MNRVSLFLMGLLFCIASATAVAQTTAINGHINGIELCAQSLWFCEGYAVFAGTFTGKVNGNDTTAAFTVRVKHDPLTRLSKA
jgi:hypothetical protein